MRKSIFVILSLCILGTVNGLPQNYMYRKIPGDQTSDCYDAWGVNGDPPVDPYTPLCVNGETYIFNGDEYTLFWNNNINGECSGAEKPTADECLDIARDIGFPEGNIYQMYEGAHMDGCIVNNGNGGIIYNNNPSNPTLSRPTFSVICKTATGVGGGGGGGGDAEAETDKTQVSSTEATLSSDEGDAATTGHGTFGLVVPVVEDIGTGAVDTGLFVSGPQHLKSSKFTCDAGGDADGNACVNEAIPTQYFENVEFSRDRCVAENIHDDCVAADETECVEKRPDFCSWTAADGDTPAACVNARTDSGHVIGYYETDDATTINCVAGQEKYCANWDNQAGKMYLDQSDYCFTMKAPEVVDNLFCNAKKSTSAQDPPTRAMKGADSDQHFDWCTTSDYTNKNPAVWPTTDVQNLAKTTSGEEGDAVLTPDMFTIEDYDILDQECYSLSGSERTEFNEIVCREANNNKKSNAAVQTYLQDFNFVDPHSDSVAYQQDSLNPTLAADDGDAKVKSFRQKAGSRYPNQEYCISQPTLLKELFGCADDQRRYCADVTDGDVKNCAGDLDSTIVDYHSDYLDWDPTGTLSSKGYGDLASTADHVCTYPEIAIANALSAYLDKSDQDITKACEQSISRFHAAVEGYVDFVNPDKFDGDSDGEVMDASYRNIYSVLRAAWRHAEFTLRSSKIQEQTLDRIRKYQDYVESHFGSAEQGVAGPVGNDVNVDANGYNSPASTTRTTGFAGFRDAFDQHVKDYILLAKNENLALKKDLVKLVGEVDKAKEFAQDLAAVQISSSSALATVSVHFRKKLKLWMSIENVLEEQMQTAFTEPGEQEHTLANLAVNKSPEPPTSSLDTIQAGGIGEGHLYNADGEDRSEEELNVGTGFVDNADGNTESIVQMSNGEVVTNHDCETAGIADQSKCDIYDYTAPANSPVHTRDATCESRDGKFVCVLPASAIGDDGETNAYDNDAVVSITVDTSVTSGAGNVEHGTDLNSVEGGYGSYDGNGNHVISQSVKDMGTDNPQQTEADHLNGDRYDNTITHPDTSSPDDTSDCPEGAVGRRTWYRDANHNGDGDADATGECLNPIISCEDYVDGYVLSCSGNDNCVDNDGDGFCAGNEPGDDIDDTDPSLGALQFCEMCDWE